MIMNARNYKILFGFGVLDYTNIFTLKPKHVL